MTAQWWRSGSTLVCVRVIGWKHGKFDWQMSENLEKKHANKQKFGKKHAKNDENGKFVFVLSLFAWALFFFQQFLFH